MHPSTSGGRRTESSDVDVLVESRKIDPDNLELVSKPAISRRTGTLNLRRCRGCVLILRLYWCPMGHPLPSLQPSCDRQMTVCFQHILSSNNRGGEMTTTMRRQPEDHIRELSAQSGGATLYVRSVGGYDGGPVLVTLHGGPGISHEYMMPLEILASEELRVVSYDQRGVGRSSGTVNS